MKLTGTYDGSMHTPIGDLPFVLKLNCEDPARITGTYTDVCRDEGHHDHGTSEILWGKVVERPAEQNPVSAVNPLKEGGENTGTYIMFNLIPHDCELTFFGVIQEDGSMYGTTFHKGHAALFSAKKAAE